MKRWLMWGVAILVILTLFFGFFYTTGGRGLSRIIPSYLLADIPDKKYGWSDFVPSSDTKKVSGFYSAAFSNDERLAMWTLAGLQIFRHQPGKSVYYHRDTCGVVAAMKAGGGAEQNNPKNVYLDTESWRRAMKQEYLLTVEWGESEGERVVENVYSVSGKYRVIGKIEGGVCE